MCFCCVLRPALLQARLDLPKRTKRTFLTTALRQRDAVTDQAMYWLQRTNVLEDLQAAAAAGIDVSDHSCVMMLHTVHSLDASTYMHVPHASFKQQGAWLPSQHSAVQ